VVPQTNNQKLAFKHESHGATFSSRQIIPDKHFQLWYDYRVSLIVRSPICLKYADSSVS
jgi:hypothetical protein